MRRTSTTESRITLVIHAAALLLVACDCGASRQRTDETPNDPVTAPPGDDGRRVEIPEVLDGDPPLPGITSSSQTAERRLREALAAKGPGYEPRTHHQEDGVPRFVNRLILETSPYLLQHAHNPVNWFPWGPEAFDEARREGKPVLLSIGYSTCHWCHVMERESFEDLEIAAYINEHYVAIKVDREERPDLDEVYMRAVQMMTGRGGWPMTVVLTPDREPFFGGTYFPPRDGARGARQGFLSILTDLATRYANERDVLIADAARMSRRLAESSQYAPAAAVPGPEVMVQTAGWLARSFESRFGGFGRAPKFPQPSRVLFLMRYYRRTRDPGALHMIEHTLDQMYRGGMYDHVAGGFHRYSTDERWLVPHFEKMLYDNAQLVVAYTEAWQLTDDAAYRMVASEVLDYVIREMTNPQGGFYSATDADSMTPSGHSEEGWFFTWTPDELATVLGAERARVVSAVYGVTPSGNFEGRNILHRPRHDDTVAAELGIDVPTLLSTVASSRTDLYQVRSRRPAPLRDDKVLTAWNGLMISAFARAAIAFSSDRYQEVARRAAQFILDELRADDGRLLRSHLDDRARHNAYLDDYAFFTAALIDTYEATGDVGFLREAVTLARLLDAHHLDPQGGWYTTSDDHEELLVRDKPSRDGALPSGNAVAIANALRLAELTGDHEHREVAERALSAFSEPMRRFGGGMPLTLAALDYYLDVPREIVVVHAEGQDPSPLYQVVAETYLPNRVLMRVSEDDARAQVETVPLLEEKATIGGAPTAFVCERGRCELPTSDPEVLRRQLSSVRPFTEGAAPQPLTVRR